MPWTYDPTKFKDTTPSSNYPPATLGQLNYVRFLIRDTNTNRQLLQDDEIYYILTQEANVFMAAAACCDTLVAIAGNTKQKKIGQFEITYDPMFYGKLANELRGRGAYHQVPYAGGISIADKQAQQDDTDWVPPAFARGMDDNPEAPAPQTSSTNPLTTL